MDASMKDSFHEFSNPFFYSVDIITRGSFQSE